MIICSYILGVHLNCYLVKTQPFVLSSLYAYDIQYNRGLLTTSGTQNYFEYWLAVSTWVLTLLLCGDYFKVIGCSKVTESPEMVFWENYIAYFQKRAKILEVTKLLVRCLCRGPNRCTR